MWTCEVFIVAIASVPSSTQQDAQSQWKPYSIVDAPQWLAAIVEYSEDAIIGESMDGIITIWNRSAEKIFGYSASEAIGEPISLLAWPGTEEDMPHLLETIRRGERVEHYETLRRHKNGTKIFVSLTLSGIQDADGKIVGILKISRDISGRKAADEALIRQARLLDEVYEPILIRTLDDRIVYWNKGAEKVYGWRSDEAIGQLSRDLLRTESPTGVASISEVSDGDGNGEGEFLHLTRDGRRRTMLRRWRRQEGLNGPEILETHFDITERKRALEQEKQAKATLLAEGKFRELIENAPDAILQVDPRGRIVVANRTAEVLFGYIREELLGQNVDILVPAMARANHFRHRESFARFPKIRPMGSGVELSALRKDGIEVPVEISLSPSRVDGGVNVTAVIRDVSERRQAEAQIRSLQANYMAELEARQVEAERLNALKSDFLASMSHELRTPLHTIIGFTELLREDIDGSLSDQQKRFLQHIHEDSQHLLGLINDVLDLTKIEAGAMSLRIEHVPLSDVISNAANAIRPRAAMKSLTVEADNIYTGLIAVDPMRLKEVFYNLLSNAVKFTPEGGTITLETEEDGDFVRTTVADSGIGIPAHQQERVFENFYQIGSSDIKEGIGLGLAISRRLVEMHGGRIWIESKPGCGSRFHFTVPKAV